jgi:hypothetical protein
MSENTYHLIHANVALARASLEDEIMSEFVEQIDEINKLASLSPGFISQPTPSDEGQIFKGNFLLNISIWESVESLSSFTHSGKHAGALDNRAKWFKPQDKPNYVLFWFPAGKVPTEVEIQKRIDYLAMHGETPYAFNFNRSFISREAKNYEVKNKA